MLQLDPAKRISLSKVLEHKWMQLGDGEMNETLTQSTLNRRTASGNVMWNEQVLLAIQRLNLPNFGVEAVKQVTVFDTYNSFVTLLLSLFQAVHKKQYNDQAALYYLLLHKWEKGQLQIPLRVAGPLPYHRYSTNSIPQIHIDGVGSASGIVPWQNMDHSHNLVPPTSNSSSDSNMDDNLARYLNQGRRHTLAAAHNVMIIPQEEMNRLRKINESSSSQASSGFGSSNTNAPVVHPEPPQTLVPTLSTGVDEAQTSTGCLVSTSRHFLQPPQHRSSRRRASDGGHYLEAYRQYLQKRNPMYAVVNAQAAVESNHLGARQLLQDKIETDRLFGRLPPKFCKQQSYNVQLLSSSGLNTSSQLSHMMQLPITSSTAPLDDAQINLRQQYQPFADITPQQVREQLEQLHMTDTTTDDQMATLPTTSGYSGNSSSSSVDSRKTSLSSSIIAQLLHASPTSSLTIMPPFSLPTQTPSASTAEYVNRLETTDSIRRFSIQPPVAPPSYSPQQVRQHRNTLPELIPQSRLAMIDGSIPPSRQISQDISSATSQDLSGSSPDTSLGLQMTGTERQSPSYPRHGSPGRQSPLNTVFENDDDDDVREERHRKVGMTLTSHEHAQMTAEVESSNLSPLKLNQVTTQLNHMAIAQLQQQQHLAGILGVNHPSILLNGIHVPSHPVQSSTQESLPGIRQIPIYFNQHVSLLHPSVANQIAQQQVSGLVAHISTTLDKYSIVYECNNNVFTITHQGVDFQIHVQVSPHYAIQNALQLNLQYMHISGDPQLYQALCTQLAPHFIPVQ